MGNKLNKLKNGPLAIIPSSEIIRRRRSEVAEELRQLDVILETAEKLENTGNGKKFEAGQWWSMRNGEIAFIVGYLSSEGLRGRLIVETETKSTMQFFVDGTYTYNEESEYDLVEHLPDCVSFDEGVQK